MKQAFHTQRSKLFILLFQFGAGCFQFLFDLLRMFRQIFPVTEFQRGGSTANLRKALIEQVVNAVTGHCFNTAHTGCRAGLCRYFEKAELCRIAHMGAAAEFLTEIIYRDNTDNLSVFFTKKCHCSNFFRFFNRHLPCHNRHSGENNIIDKHFHLPQFHFR